MKTPGYRIGQAANLAHAFIVEYAKTKTLSEEEFNHEWKKITKHYIGVLNEFEHEFGDDEDWTDKKPEPKPTPVKLDFGDGQVIDTETN